MLQVKKKAKRIEFLANFVLIEICLLFEGEGINVKNTESEFIKTFFFFQEASHTNHTA